jgi:hypothetical protein
MKRTSILSLTAVVAVSILALTVSAAAVNCSGVAAWSANSVSYSVGKLVTFNGSEYKCIQAHASEVGWDPAAVPALWSLVGSCSGGGGGATPTPTAKGTPKATPTPTGGGGGTGSKGKIFAPYIDMSTALAENLEAVRSASGINLFSAAFIVGAGCTPQWGGMFTGLNGNMNNGQSFISNINNLHAAGGDIIMSNGGSAQAELADSCMNVSATQAGYQAEVSTFHLKYIDFDIETSQAGLDVRSQAVAALERANPGLVVSVTLPVLPTGLVQGGLNVISSARSHGMRIDTVNVMAMDYGSGADNGGQMGVDAEDAAIATHNQTGMNIGITPMIGVNDTSTEIFTLSDANSVLSWAKGQSYVNRLSYWSVTRDNGGCAGARFASATCSGVSQGNYAFARIFESF